MSRARDDLTVYVDNADRKSQAGADSGEKTRAADPRRGQRKPQELERQRSRSFDYGSDPRTSTHAKGSPIGHQHFASPKSQCAGTRLRPCWGSYGPGQLGHFPGEAGFLRHPIAERRTKTVDGHARAPVAQYFEQRHVRKRSPRVLARENQVADRGSEHPRPFQHVEHRFGQPHDMDIASFHPLGGDRPDLFLDVDL